MDYQSALWMLLYLWGINFVLCLPMIFIVKKCKIYSQFPEINEKYPSFARPDLERWNIWKMIFFGTFTMGPFRFLTSWTCVIIILIGLTFMLIGSKLEKNVPMAKCRYAMVKPFCWAFGRIHYLSSGCIWIKRNKKKLVCYKKYLGPDWKPHWDGFGIQIANHQSWCDIMGMVSVDVPSFVAKEEVASYFAIGAITRAI